MVPAGSRAAMPSAASAAVGSAADGFSPPLPQPQSASRPARNSNLAFRLLINTSSKTYGDRDNRLKRGIVGIVRPRHKADSWPGRLEEVSRQDAKGAKKERKELSSLRPP